MAPPTPITTFKQGEDTVLTVSVIKSGSPVDLSSCPNVKAILKVQGTECKKYAIIPETDFGDLKIGSFGTYGWLSNNQASLIIERDHSINFPVGAVSVILLASFTDPNFADNIRVEEYKFNIGRVITGEGTAEIIP